jgi:hypothetical protein
MLDILPGLKVEDSYCRDIGASVAHANAFASAGSHFVEAAGMVSRLTASPWAAGAAACRFAQTACPAAKIFFAAWNIERRTS